ncbi:DUF5684 domain-containing protein [Agromyces humatus]|uniref:Signal peptidase I n=1 Tax=Agromyces humatus TaxID=279573 RepID=A0ABN2KKY1_9MICO|nr:DUF5684 domain-containing protein [Agromyces humatus]
MQEPVIDIAAVLVPMLVLWAGLAVYGAATYVLNGVFLSRVFAKTGAEGWPAWVPVYNSWRLLELGGQPGWLALLVFVPGANIVALVFVVIAAHRIGLGFGKGGGWAVLYFFVPLVWGALLAFGNTGPWRGSTRVGAAAPVAAPGV